MNHQLVRYSKFLSLVLRHCPQRIGLTLDSGGRLTDHAHPANIQFPKEPPNE